MQGICALTVIPVRGEASDKSEMVSQLLFGETWTQLAEEEKWIRIRIDADGYEGWIDRKQAHFCDKALPNVQSAHTLELVQSATSKDRHVPLVLGSPLRDYDGMNFKLLKERFVYNGQATDPERLPGDSSMISKIAMKYLGAPYLWGGRNPFGIDCSGLSQVVFKVAGYQLPRDAWQQAAEGSVVDFAHLAKAGDLAFFDNEEGRITHVGIMLEPGKIIHASGRVRIDKLDQQGIYDVAQGRYSHKLRIIKRMHSNS